MVDIPAPVVFLMIVGAVPLQILLSSKSSEMDYYVHETKESFNRAWAKLRGLPEPAPAPPRPSAAALKERAESDLVPSDAEFEKSYYGAADYIRDPRPPVVKFHVGQVIQHKIHKYRGVIIGWDEKEHAPEDWLLRVRGDKDERPDPQPNYAVLIDMRGRLLPEMGYIVQENMERVGGRVIHPLVDQYFEGYNGDGIYRPRPWLREVYPHDE